MKVKPMINGIEVKVGQIWCDTEGTASTITEIYSDGGFEDDLCVVYHPNGKPCTYPKRFTLVELIKDVETPDYNLKVKAEPETIYGVTTADFLTKLRKVQVEAKPKATFTESEINTKINQVIKDFDWQKAASVYTALNWTWYTTQGIPTVGELVVAGVEHMKQAVQIAVANQEEGYVSSGGLIGRAYITDGELVVSLEMQVTEAISGY